MRICFVCQGSLRDYTEACTQKDCEREEVDLIFFGFNGMGEVSYERELKGETSLFEEAARLSKERNCVVVCGCITDTRGHKRKSAVVAQKGRLSGVSDMTNVVDGEVNSGASLRVYETQIGRMGVIVGEDLDFPEVVKALAVCGSDFIVCPFGKADEVRAALLRAGAYCYGVPILFCADGYCTIADVSGEIVFASPQSPASLEFTPIKEYHLVETRRRGFHRPKKIGM